MADIVRQYEQLPPALKLVSGVLLIGLTGYFAWEEFITPKLQIIAEKTETRTKHEDELKLLNRDYVSPVTLEEELSAANREFKKLIEILPQDSSIDRVLNDFAGISRVTGTEIREFVPDTAGTNKTLTNVQSAASQNNVGNQAPKSNVEQEETNAVSLQMRMFGTFPAIVSFLDMSMSLPRVIRLQEFEISNPDKDLKLTQKPKLTFKGIFHAYYQKQNSQTEKVNSEPASDEKSRSPTAAIGKPAVDLNEVIDKSFSAKPLNGGAE